METSNERLSKIIKYIKRPFVLFSLSLILLGFIFLIIQKIDNRKYDKEITAVVTSVSVSKDKDGDNKYQAHCEYQINGKTYNYETDTTSKRISEGDKIKVHINSDNPEKTNKIWYKKIAAVFFFFGGALFLGSFYYE